MGEEGSGGGTSSDRERERRRERRRRERSFLRVLVDLHLSRAARGAISGTTRCAPVNVSAALSNPGRRIAHLAAAARE